MNVFLTDKTWAEKNKMTIAQMLQSMEHLAPMYTGLKHLKSKLIFHNSKFTAGFYILSYNKRRFTIATQI